MASVFVLAKKSHLHMSPWQATATKKKRAVEEQTADLRSYVKQLNSQFDGQYKVMVYWSRHAVSFSIWDDNKKGWKQARGFRDQKNHLIITDSSSPCSPYSPAHHICRQQFPSCCSCRCRAATPPLGRRMTWSLHSWQWRWWNLGMNTASINMLGYVANVLFGLASKKCHCKSQNLS